jgi:hypothetical protein
MNPARRGDPVSDAPQTALLCHLDVGLSGASLLHFLTTMLSSGWCLFKASKVICRETFEHID